MVEGVFQDIEGQVRARDASLSNTSTHSGQRFSAQQSDPDHRLPKLNYHTMKEKQIRELLSQAELSTTGDKSVLVARHQQYGFICSTYGSLLMEYSGLRWTMLYNANQDRSVNQRQDLEQLRKELKKSGGEGKVKKIDIGDTEEYQVCHGGTD
jgi:E3 ubiquitin-protein ligase RAD18